jgi:hypothetical protein
MTALHVSKCVCKAQQQVSPPPWTFGFVVPRLAQPSKSPGQAGPPLAPPAPSLSCTYTQLLVYAHETIHARSSKSASTALRAFRMAGPLAEHIPILLGAETHGEMRSSVEFAFFPPACWECQPYGMRPPTRNSRGFLPSVVSHVDGLLQRGSECPLHCSRPSSRSMLKKVGSPQFHTSSEE